jgi:single-strand DNA-binding protein
MSKGTNKAILLGHVGKDPEIRSTAGGRVVANFSLPTADRKKEGGGNWTGRAEWHNLVAFNRTAEVVRDCVRKGTQLFVEGKIQTRSWDDRISGQKRYRTEILVNDLTLLNDRQVGKSMGSSYDSGWGYPRGNTRGSGQSRHATDEEYAFADQGISDDDIPF